MKPYDKDRPLRGSLWDQHAANASTASSGDERPRGVDEQLGFRLVFDASPRDNRGGGWYDSTRNARAPHHFESGPTGRYGRLSFRLVREVT